MSGWLIYHPRREHTHFDDVTVYHDNFIHNQDPYVWNSRFLHTACHMPQMSPQVKDINFWVSADSTLGHFSQLLCDLVFVVEEKIYWKDANKIEEDDPVIESAEAYADHYYWMPKDHGYKKKRRFTLKANAALSFQPQNETGNLTDIVPFFNSFGLGLPELRNGLAATRGSKPMRLSDSVATGVYDQLVKAASVRLEGAQIEAIRKNHPKFKQP